MTDRRQPPCRGDHRTNDREPAHRPLPTCTSITPASNQTALKLPLFSWSVASGNISDAVHKQKGLHSWCPREPHGLVQHPEKNFVKCLPW